MRRTAKLGRQIQGLAQLDYLSLGSVRWNQPLIFRHQSREESPMTQALQLLTVAVVGLGLACYALVVDRKEHLKQPDPRQQPLFPETPRQGEKGD
jgi:hypothetical protein